MSNYPGALSGGFVSHRFQSLKSDQPDLSVINPSNWNQSHIIGSGAIQSGALGASMVNSGNISALSVTSGAIASGATSWNLFGPSKPFVTVTPNGPTDGGDYGPNTVGTTTAGIQEAINSLIAGGRIFIAIGIYTISTQISIKYNGIFIQGAGMNKTILQGSNAVFPASTELLIIPDGVYDVTLQDFKIIQSTRSTYSALHIVSGVSGAGHTRINLDRLYLVGQGVSGYAVLQVDSLDFSKWGLIQIEGFAYGLAWQAINKSVNSYLANSSIQELYIVYSAIGYVPNTACYLQNLGFLQIANITTQGKDVTTGNGLVIDGCGSCQFTFIDVELYNNPVVFEGTAVNANCINNAILGGYAAGKIACTFTNNSHANLCQDVVWDKSTSAGSTSIIDSSVALASNFNVIQYGSVNGATLVSVTNPPRLKMVDVSGYAPPASLVTMGVSPFTFSYLPYDYQFFISSPNGITGLTINGTAVPITPAGIVMVAHVGDTVVGTWATAAPVYQILQPAIE